MSTLVYPHFTQFTHVLPQLIHFYPCHACFTPLQIPMFFPSYPRFFPFFVYPSLFTFFIICLPSMLTQVYLRSNPFTHVCSFLSMFYPIYRCLRQLTRLTLLTHVYPNLSTLYPGEINRVHSYLEKGFRRNVHAKILKDKMGYDKYTVPDSTDTAVVEPTFLLSFSTRRHTSMASRAILSNFFQEQ